ncbi:MAG: aldo/keto reductase [Succinivibrio sp.]
MARRRRRPASRRSGRSRPRAAPAGSNGRGSPPSQEAACRRLADEGGRAKENDLQIIRRVDEVAGRLGVSMAEVSLAWLLKRGVESPIVGATSPVHFAEAARAVDLELSDEDARCLEEPYRAHDVVGALDRNPKGRGPLPTSGGRRTLLILQKLANLIAAFDFLNILPGASASPTMQPSDKMMAKQKGGCRNAQ